jgi:hypothetical protein
MAQKQAAKQRAPRADPTPAPDPDELPDDDDFRVLPGGKRIEWFIEGQLYELARLKLGDYEDLDERVRAGSVEYRYLQAAAVALPLTNMEEAQAKAEALSKANAAANAWLHDWWARLFKATEQNGREFPHVDAPPWVTKAGVMSKMLDALVGKPPPGVA